MSRVENHKADAAASSADARTELTVRDVLIAARKLIQKEENWAQGIYQDRTLTRFCSAGAILHVQGIDYNRHDRPLPAELALLSVISNEDSVFSFNDGHTHAEVLAAFDRAIEQCAVGDQSCAPTPAAGA